MNAHTHILKKNAATSFTALKVIQIPMAFGVPVVFEDRCFILTLNSLALNAAQMG
jgi:hypothetical protein